MIQYFLTSEDGGLHNCYGLRVF